MKMNNQFFGITPLHGDLWYCEELKEWRNTQDAEAPFSNYVHVLSFKAARRHIRKHKEIPDGTKFLLASRWVGYDRVLVKK